MGAVWERLGHMRRWRGVGAVSGAPSEEFAECGGVWDTALNHQRSDAMLQAASSGQDRTSAGDRSAPQQLCDTPKVRLPPEGSVVPLRLRLAGWGGRTEAGRWVSPTTTLQASGVTSRAGRRTVGEELGSLRTWRPAPKALPIIACAASHLDGLTALQESLPGSRGQDDAVRPNAAGHPGPAAVQPPGCRRHRKPKQPMT